jgi:hypothetical protein
MLTGEGSLMDVAPHLNQFLGKSHFELEHKIRAFLSEKDFLHTVEKFELEDRAIVDYWFK